MSECNVKEMSASEALSSFAGWLTTRKEKITMSSSNDSAPVWELVKEFIDVQGLEEPSKDWPNNAISMKGR